MVEHLLFFKYYATAICNTIKSIHFLIFLQHLRYVRTRKLSGVVKSVEWSKNTIDYTSTHFFKSCWVLYSDLVQQPKML